MDKGNIKFGRWEAVCLLVAMISAKSILNYPRFQVDFSGPAAWLSVVFVTLLALGIISVIFKLYKPFQGKDPIDLGEIAAGPAGKIIAGSVIFLFVGVFTVTALRDYSEQMKVLALNTSPITYIMLFFTAGMITGLLTGIEPIVRFQAILMPVLIISYIIFIVLLTPYFKSDNLFPFLGLGLKKIIPVELPRISDYTEIIFLFLMYPFLKKHSIFKSAGYISLGISFFFLLSVTLSYQLIVQYPTSTEWYIPVYQMGRLINYGRFFQRIESAFVTTWTLTGLIYTCTGFYFMVSSFAKTFGIKDKKPMVAAFAVITFSLALVPKSLLQNSNLKGNFLYAWGWTVTFGLTILLLVIARIRTRKHKDRKQSA